jgi:hypothetical protein
MKIDLNPKLLFRSVLTRLYIPWGTVVIAGTIQGISGALMLRFIRDAIPFHIPAIIPYIIGAMLGAFYSLFIWLLGGLVLSLAGRAAKPFLIWGESFKIMFIWALISLPLGAFLAPHITVPSVSNGDTVALLQSVTISFTQYTKSLGPRVATWGGNAILACQIILSYFGLKEAGSHRAGFAVVILLLLSSVFIVAPYLLPSVP